MVSYSVLLLFFLQILTAYVAANYSLGLLHNRLPPESISALFLFSPILFPLFNRWGRSALYGLAAVVVATRLAYPLIDDTRLVVLATGIGVASSLLLLAIFLRRHVDIGSSSLAGGLALAAAASIALRAAGSGVDASTLGAGQLLAWPLGLVALRSMPSQVVPGSPTGTGQTGRVVLVCLGLFCVVALVYFAFSAPNVIARWTGADYLAVNAIVLAALLAGCVLAASAHTRAFHRPARLAIATAAFAVLLSVAILAHQLNFPADPTDYPLAETDAPWWSAALLVATLLLWPILVLDFWKLTEGLGSLDPSARSLGFGLAGGAILLGALIFAQIFTTTYDYVPVIGPLFRDQFWIVTATPALLLALALFALPRMALSSWEPRILFTVVLSGLAVAALAAVIYVESDPQAEARDELTIVTYNVQQGYDADNRRNFDGQLDLLRGFDADIIGLQESDTGRVAGGNDDLVRYFADNLDLHSYYGPKTVTGTFGVALLSRYPIEEARTYYLFSEGEQKAVISARVTVAGRPLQVYIVHLGNGGPLIQQEQLLSLVAAQASVIMAGDFNFRPDTPQYRLTVEQLDDAWLKQPSAGSLPDPDRDRIDYVFVSSSIDVREAAYVDSPESNHPAFVVKIAR